MPPAVLRVQSSPGSPFGLRANGNHKVQGDPGVCRIGGDGCGSTRGDSSTVTVGVVPVGSLRAKFTLRPGFARCPEALPGPGDLSGRILPEGLQDRREPRSPGRSRCPSDWR